VWTNVYLGTASNLVWIEASFPQGTTTQARIRYKVISWNYGLDWELNEFDFHRVVSVTIAGEFDGATPVSLAVDGSYQSTYTGPSPYSFSTFVGAGDHILVFYDDDDNPQNSAALVTTATGSDQTNLNLEANTLIIRSDNATTSNDDLVAAHSGDPDVPYVFSGEDVSVATNIALEIPAGHTFRPGANDLLLRNVLTVDGAFEHVDGAMIFALKTAIRGAGAPEFHNVTISGALAGSSNLMEVTGDWVNNGTFYHTSGAIDFSGDTTVSGTSSSRFSHVTISGALTAPAATLYLDGNWTNNGSFTNGGGTVVFDGTTTVAGSADSRFNNVAISSSGALTGPSGILFVDGNWDNSAGGTFDPTSGTVEFGGTGVSVISGDTKFNNLDCRTPGKQISFSAGADQGVSGALNLLGSSSSDVVLRSTVGGSKWDITVSSAQSVAFVDVRDSDANDNTITVVAGTDSGNNNANWVFDGYRYWVGGAGVWSDTGHWSASSGGPSGASIPTSTQQAIFDSNSGGDTCTVDQAIDVGGILLETGNAVVMEQATGNTIDLGEAGFQMKAGEFHGGNSKITVIGSLLLDGGQFTSTSGDIECHTDLFQNGGVFIHNSGRAIFAGTSSTAGSTNSFNQVLISGGLTVTNLTTIAGNFENNGTFEHNGGTVAFNGTTVVSGTSTTRLNDVVMSGSLTAHAFSMYVDGNWTNNGVFSHNSGTLVFNGYTTMNGSSATAFNNVTVDDTLIAPETTMRIAGSFANNGSFGHHGGAVIFDGTTTVGGTSETVFNNVTVSGTLTAHSDTMRVSGDWVNDGTFNHNNGLLIFNGTSSIGGSETTTVDDVTFWGDLTVSTDPLSVEGNFANEGTYNASGRTTAFRGATALSGSSSITLGDVLVDGSLTSLPGSLSFTGDWDGSAGTFMHNGGVIVVDGTNTQTITTGGAWNGTTNNWKNNWNELVINNASTSSVIFTDGFKTAKLTDTTPGSVLYFQWEDGGQNVFEITDSGGLTLLGATNQLIKLRRYGGSAGDRWFIYPSTPDGMWSVSYVDVMDSENTADDPIYPSFSLDSGNNENWFTPTLVLISSFSANLENNEVVVRWETAWEMGAVGFFLERLGDSNEYHAVNETLLPAFLFPDNSYEIVDPEAVAGGTYTYRLIEVDVFGDRNTYGPYTVTVGGAGHSFEEWRIAHFTPEELNDPSISAPEADHDGDGHNNLQEFHAGTDPNDASSVLNILKAKLAGGEHIIWWLSASNETYTIENSPSLSDGFSPFVSGIPATPPVNVYTSQVTGGSAFYRISIE